MALNKLNIRNAIWLWLGATRRAAPVYCTRAAFSSIVPPVFRDQAIVDATFTYALLKEAPNLFPEDSLLVSVNLHTWTLTEPIKTVTFDTDYTNLAVNFSSINLTALGFEETLIQEAATLGVVFNSIDMRNIVLSMETVSDSATISSVFHSISLT